MSLEAQRQIRENAEEARSYVQGLVSWQRDVRERRKGAAARTVCSPRRRPGAVSMELSASVRRSDDATSLMTSDHHADTHPAAAAADPVAAAQAKREEGNGAFRRGDYGRAIALYSASIRLHPTCFGYANRAMARLKRREFSDCEADCSAALELDPTFLKAHQRRAVARKELGKWCEALGDAEMALRLQPSSPALRTEFHQLLEEVLAREQVNLDLTPHTIHPIPNQGPHPTPDAQADILSHEDPSPQPPERTNTPQTPDHDSDAIAEVPVENHVTEEDQATLEGESGVNAGERSLESEGRSCEGRVEVPKVPESWTEFESAYKKLKTQPEAFSVYLSHISPPSLPSLFKSALTAPVLASILDGVLQGVSQNVSQSCVAPMDWIAFLNHLRTVPRYDMLLMCFTKKQKEFLKRRWTQESEHLSTETQTQLRPFFHTFL